MNDNIKDYEDSMNDFSLTWKSYQVLREGLVVTDKELQELIDYNEVNERYEICEKLNNLKNGR
jgi:hypothetical protein